MHVEDHSAIENVPDEEILAVSLVRPSVFEVLVDRYQDAFLRKARGFVRSTEEAEDIVQETFTKIYRAAPRFVKVPGASFKSWAYRILINTAITHYRVQKKRGVVMSLDDEDIAAATGADIGVAPDVHETPDYVLSILARLPTGFSRILSLYFLKDMSHKEIAEEEGLTVSAVKARIHRAKQAFRDEKKAMAEHM